MIHHYVLVEKTDSGQRALIVNIGSYFQSCFFGAFLLPGGRQRRFSAFSWLAATIHAGGRPLRFPCPAAIRSRLKIASVSCACSTLSVVRMLPMSIGAG